jgi:hypothetical protein
MRWIEMMPKKLLFFLLTILGLVITGCRSVKEDHFAIYLLAEDHPATKLSQLDINQIRLESEPIISSEDVILYDQASHTIELTQAAYTRVQKTFPMPVKVDGIPFVICVGKERIYAGAFWTPLSSISFDGVVILQPMDTTKTTIQITLGYPVQAVFTGKDLRADPRIIKSLEQDKKLK